MYRSKVRLHLTKDGQVVLPGHPKSASLLVPAGGTLSDEVAARYGLTGSKKDEILPLESSPPSTPSSPSLVAPPVAATQQPFPAEIRLGSLATPPQQPAPAPPAPAAATPPPVSTPPAQTEQPPAAQTNQPPGDLPIDFPHREILEAQGFGLMEKVMVATKDELIALDQIGVARADDIIAARDALK